MFAAGLSDQEMADALGISYRTVIGNRLALGLRKNGLIKPEPVAEPTTREEEGKLITVCPPMYAEGADSRRYSAQPRRKK